ncbi:MAG: patatin-like phospholipase family protein [Ignavibacteria bacterium]
MKFRIFTLTVLSFVVINSQAKYKWVEKFDGTSLQSPKIGLAISGGGALGFAHIGVLRIIDSLQIPIDYIAGTSMGAITGGLYAAGYSGIELDSIVNIIDWEQVFSDQPSRGLLPYIEKKFTGRYQVELDLKGFTPTIPKGVISGQNVMMQLLHYAHAYEKLDNFNKLPIPFNCVAADLISGNEVILKNGSLVRAIRASMSIPSIFNPVEIGDSLLVDGGVINNYPVDVVKNMGADIIIGLRLKFPEYKKEEYDNLFNIIDRVMDIPRKEKLEENISMTDIYIEEDIKGFSLADFDKDKIKLIIERGIKAAYKNIDELAELKKQLENYGGLSKKRKKEKAEGIIHRINITGNENLEFTFIYNLLRLNPGEKFNINKLEERINELYGLGFFELITYDIMKLDDDRIELTIIVKEKLLRNIFVGFRYDNFHKLVGLTGVKINNFLIDGLRVESELQFSGLTRFNTKILYPSRYLDLPVYPLVDINHKSLPVNIYSDGSKIAQYRDRSWSVGVGLGFPLSRSLNIEVLYNRESMDITADIASQDQTDAFPDWEDNLAQLLGRFRLDLLDNRLIPRNGIELNADLELSSKTLGSELSFGKFNVSFDWYNTFSKIHTIRLFSFYMNSWRGIPVYKWYYFGGPETFVGQDYTEIAASTFTCSRVEYRYAYKKDIFFKAVFNIGFNCILNNASEDFFDDPIYGHGFAVEFNSILGPIQIMYSEGEERELIHFTAGVKF